jgi:peptide deformylase
LHGFSVKISVHFEVDNSVDDIVNITRLAVERFKELEIEVFDSKNGLYQAAVRVGLRLSMQHQFEHTHGVACGGGRGKRPF